MQGKIPVAAPEKQASKPAGRPTRVRAMLGIVDVLDLQAEQRVRQPRLLRCVAGAPQDIVAQQRASALLVPQQAGIVFNTQQALADAQVASASICTSLKQGHIIPDSV